MKLTLLRIACCLLVAGMIAALFLPFFAAVFLWLFVLSQLLLFLGMCAAPFVLSPSDTMLTGYFLLTGCEIGLFVLVYKLVRRKPKVNRMDQELLDDNL